MQIHGLGAVIEVRGIANDDPVWAPWERCRLPQVSVPVVGKPTDVPAGIDASSLTQQITRALISVRSGQILLLHAGAVCHPQTGATVVYVGRGGTGKTTLTALLGQHYGYLTDETAAITSDGTVLSYPKPLSVRVDGRAAKVETGPDELGLLPAHPAPKLARIVLLSRDGSKDPAVETLDLLDAVEAITPESSALSQMDRGLHQLAAVIEAVGPVQQWHYSEAPDLLPLVSRTIGEPA